MSTEIYATAFVTVSTLEAAAMLRQTVAYQKVRGQDALRQVDGAKGRFWKVSPTSRSTLAGVRGDCGGGPH